MRKNLLFCTLVLVIVSVCTITTGSANAAEVDSVLADWASKGQRETGLTIFMEETVIMSTHGEWVPGVPAGQPRPQTVQCFGLKDASGNVVLPAKYSELSYVGPDRLSVAGTDMFEDGWGIISLSGKTIVPFALQEISVKEIPEANTSVFLTADLANSNLNNQKYVGLFDWNGNALIPWGTCRSIEQLEGRYFRISKGETANGIYSYGVGEVIPCQYIALEYLGDGLFMTENPNGLCGVLDHNGNQELPFAYEYIRSYVQGCYIISKITSEHIKDSFQKYGTRTELFWDNTVDALIDSQGNYLIPFQYDRITIDSNGHGYAGMWNGKY